MNQDPKPHGPTDDPENQSHESGLDVPIFDASSWRPQPFRAARFYTTSQMAKFLVVILDASALPSPRRTDRPQGHLHLATCLALLPQRLRGLAQQAQSTEGCRLMSGKIHLPVAVSLSADIEVREGLADAYRARVRWTDPHTKKRKSTSATFATREEAEEWIGKARVQRPEA